MTSSGVFSACHFLAYVDRPSAMPKESCPEVAFVGRSNVGKSSLLNALINKKSFARVSKTPGRTQAIHFYEMGAGKLRIIDLPGYGYSKVPAHQRKKWPELIEYYLKNRISLKRVFLLLDGGYFPKDSDSLMKDFLEALGITYSCVLTKTDRISSSQLNKNVEEIKNRFLPPSLYCTGTIFCTSTIKKKGIEDIKKELFNMLSE